MFINLQVNGTCDGSSAWNHCAGQVRFSQYIFSPYNVTEWVNITRMESCDLGNLVWFCVSEVHAIGNFVDAN